MKLSFVYVPSSPLPSPSSHPSVCTRGAKETKTKETRALPLRGIVCNEMIIIECTSSILSSSDQKSVLAENTFELPRPLVRNIYVIVSSLARDEGQYNVTPLQKSTADLRQLSLEQPPSADPVSPWLESGNMANKQFPIPI